jgi:hypothetical protein
MIIPESLPYSEPIDVAKIEDLNSDQQSMFAFFC